MKLLFNLAVIIVRKQLTTNTKRHEKGYSTIRNQSPIKRN